MSKIFRLGAHGRSSTRLLAGIVASGLLVVSLFVPQAAFAAKIGVAAMVQNEVNGTIAGQTKALSVGSELFTNQRIQTGANGTAQFLFLDQTTLTIGPKSDVTLDRFIYDPKKATGDVVLETTRGAFRFISGAQTADSYKIKTPVATIGVRGSMIYGVGGPNYFVFYVGEGTGFVIPNGMELIDNIPAGRAVIILTDGRVIIGKFDVGELDLARMRELLPLFEDIPDNFQDIIDQLAPEFGTGGGE